MLMAMLASMLYAAPAKISWVGYVQGRYDKGITTGVDSFQAKRYGVWLRIMQTEKVGATVFAANDANGKIELQHAYANYINGTLETRAGLSPVPFGYENPITSCKLITLERSLVSGNLIGPNALDRGVFLYYTPGNGLNASVALINGVPYNIVGTNDNNKEKNPVARIGYSIKGGEIGVSMIGGTIAGNPAVGPTKDALGIDIETVQGPFTIVAEAIQGEIGTPLVDANGGYLTVAYKANALNQPYLRLETFDPNTDVDDNEIQRYTLGYSYFLSPTGKLSAEYQIIDDETVGNPANGYGLQYQVIFQ